MADSKISLELLRRYKREGRKFSCLTAYDAAFAQAINGAGVELILVGDSLGMVLQGHSTPIPVTPDDIAYHTACVARAKGRCLLMADLPFMSYGTPDDALKTAAQLLRAGAEIVKLEGGRWLCDTVSRLYERGIPVCAHLGLTPQSVNKIGGFRVQGRSQEQACVLIEDARLLEAAGASLLLLECVPASLGLEVTAAVGIPVIGIGAGPGTDAQILVLHDMLGITPGHRPRFVRNFMADAPSVQDALAAYADAVREGRYPEQQHSF